MKVDSWPTLSFSSEDPFFFPKIGSKSKLLYEITELQELRRISKNKKFDFLININRKEFQGY